MQKLRTAIGTRRAPSYANIFMDRLERQLISQAAIKLHTWWRFIDDIFVIWTVGEHSLQRFIEDLNNAHRTIKFTSKWSCSEIEFLDVRVINDSGKLETDFFIKPTDRHQYLHKTSHHPNTCKKGIPFAQVLGLRQIFSKNSFFEKRASDWGKFLEERGYKKKYVEEQIDRARKTSRKENNRVPFLVLYHPGLPHIRGLLQKLHPVLHSSIRCKEAIPQVPTVAYRKSKSLAQYLVRAPFTNTPKERIDGTLKCTSKNCQICKFLCLGNTFCSSKNGKEFKINYNLGCNCGNIIYQKNCKKCKMQYVRSTTTRFRTRFNNHKSRVNAYVDLSLNQKMKDDLIYRHFNIDGLRGLEKM